MVRVLASHQRGLGSNPGVDAICGLNLFLVLSFAPRGFSPGTPVFPSLQNQHFQIPIRLGLSGQMKNHFVDVLPPNHYLLANRRINSLERLPVQKDTPFKNDNLCIPCLRLNIVKKNHTLSSGTNPLIGPNKVRQCLSLIHI